VPVGVTMHRCSMSVDQLKVVQNPRVGPARTGLGTLADVELAVELSQPVKGEQWPGVVTQQTLNG